MCEIVRSSSRKYRPASSNFNSSKTVENVRPSEDSRRASVRSLIPSARAYFASSRTSPCGSNCTIAFSKRGLNEPRACRRSESLSSQYAINISLRYGSALTSGICLIEAGNTTLRRHQIQNRRRTRAMPSSPRSALSTVHLTLTCLGTRRLFVRLPNNAHERCDPKFNLMPIRERRLPTSSIADRNYSIIFRTISDGNSLINNSAIAFSSAKSDIEHIRGGEDIINETDLPKLKVPCEMKA